MRLDISIRTPRYKLPEVQRRCVQRLNLSRSRVNEPTGIANDLGISGPRSLCRASSDRSRARARVGIHGAYSRERAGLSNFLVSPFLKSRSCPTTADIRVHECCTRIYIHSRPEKIPNERITAGTVLRAASEGRGSIIEKCELEGAPGLFHEIRRNGNER